MRDNYKRFFRNDNFEGQIEDIFDRSLFEFPVFGMNDSYLKAIGTILSVKVKQIYMLRKQALDIIDKVIEKKNIQTNRIQDFKQKQSLLCTRTDFEDGTATEMFTRETRPMQSTKHIQQSLTNNQRCQAQEKLEDLKHL
jgi:hypothetical protein